MSQVGHSELPQRRRLQRETNNENINKFHRREGGR